MQKKKIITVASGVLAACLLLTGCGNESTLKEKSTVVKFEEGKITADELYKSLKEKYGISALVDLIDHELLDEKYKETAEEKEYIDTQVSQMKAQYGGHEASFLNAIKQYLGVNSEDELRELLSLEYKRTSAIEDYVKNSLTEDEINNYYENKVVGDMKVRHILIRPETNSDMSNEDIEKAEKEAKKKAEDIIKSLDEGADFKELAKEHSDDPGSSADGGLIDYFNIDDNMDEAFLNASIKLKKGKYSSEPVKSSFGYHIILKVDQKKKPKLKDSKEAILNTLMEEKLSSDATLRYNALIAIREEAGIKFKDNQLKKEYNELMEDLIDSAK